MNEDPSILYMCKTDYDYELGYAAGGNRVHPSIEDLRRCHPCVDSCGIVEVEVILRKVIQESLD